MVGTTQNSIFFEKEVLWPLICEQVDHLDQVFHAQKEVLLAENLVFLKEKMKELSEFQKTHQKDPLMYLHLSWLIAPYIQEKKSIYDFQVYGENWYEDLHHFNARIEYPFLDKYLIQAEQAIEQLFIDTRHYELINQIDSLMSRYFEYFHAYLLALFKKNFLLHAQELFEHVETGEKFYLYGGEFRGEQECLYFYEKPVPLDQLFLEDLSTIFMSQSVVDDYDLSGLNFKGQTIQKISAKGTDFQQSSFYKSLIIDVDFREANLIGADFSSAVLQDCHFSYANCSGSNFSMVQGKTVPSHERLPSYLGLDFSYANLDQANFISAQLKGATFRGASMKGTKILKEQRSELILSEKQVQEIDWREK